MAGDLMFQPYAEYHARNPLPICGTIHGRPARIIKPPPVHCVRRVVQDMGEHRPRQHTASQEKYIAALSATAWRSAKMLAEAMGVSQQYISNFMRTKAMKKLVTRAVRSKGNTRYLVWKLK